jgi:hypothetical protein
MALTNIRTNVADATLAAAPPTSLGNDNKYTESSLIDGNAVWEDGHGICVVP